MKYRLCEIFYSIQGEGVYLGTPTVFIRFSGCNLSCVWCDTGYAREEGTEMSLKTIMERVERYPGSHVCLTGGEPLLQNDLAVLVHRVLDSGRRVLLETNGSISVKQFLDSWKKLSNSNQRTGIIISMDVKTPSSSEDGSFLLENLDILEEHDVLKFIVGSEKDMDFTKKFLDENRIKCPVLVQSVQGVDHKHLAQLFLNVNWPRGMDVRFGLQIHKMIWGPDTRGV